MIYFAVFFEVVMERGIPEGDQATGEALEDGKSV